jgi:tRNA G46 methylase TrmB
MKKRLYYALSVIRVLVGFRRPWRVLYVLAGAKLRPPERVAIRNGPEFLVRSRMDAWCVKETWLDQFYERHLGAVRSDWSVIDIGAGIGDFTVKAAMAARNGFVLALEPFPDSHALLLQNLKLNNCANVRAHRAEKTAP